MGTSEFAVPALQALHSGDHQIVAVVTAPDRPAGRKLKLRSSPVKLCALELGYPLFQPESLKDKVFQDYIRDCHADLFVVVAFRILPKSLFSIPRFGAVNIHASLLPEFRGAAPIHRAILSNAKKTGITIFQIAPKVDTGAILLQKEIPLNMKITGGELSDKLSDLGASALTDVLIQLESGGLEPLEQNDALASAAPKIDSEDTRVDWERSALDIHNQIRAFTPTPGAYAFLKENRVKLFDSESIDKAQPSLNPGEFIIDQESLLTGTGAGLLRIRSIQLEGKKRMAVSDFVKGYPQSEKSKFG